MKSYPWVSNEVKLTRAYLELKKLGNTNPTEEQVKELYVKYGGLVLEPTAEEATAEDEPKKKKNAK